MLLYSEAWTVENEAQIRQTYADAGLPPDSFRLSVWNARATTEYMSGRLTRQDARWSMLNALRHEINAQYGKSLPDLPEPVWCGEEIGTLRPEGLTILNDGTENGTMPWLAMGYRMFDTICLHLYGMQSFDRSLDYPCRLGYGVMAVGTMMDGRNPNNHPATLSPALNADLYQKIGDCADIAKARGVRLWAYSSADARALGLSEAQEHQHFLMLDQVLGGGFHIPSAANEGAVNGNSSDVQAFPRPTRCPVWTRGSCGEFPPHPNGATAAELEVFRRGEYAEPFKMEGDSMSIRYHTLDASGPHLGVPVAQVENIGFADVSRDGRRSNDPTLAAAFATAAARTRPWGSLGYFQHTDSGRLGRAPLAGGREDACNRAAIQALRTGFTA